jgi:hypothetical protein
LDTAGFSVVDQTTVSAGFEETWQFTKAALRDRELDISTRDTRGLFVAWTPGKRQWYVKQRRTQYTIILEEVSATATRVTVETLDQVYGVTLLTYPDWHDRKTKDSSAALAILESIQAKATDV